MGAGAAAGAVAGAAGVRMAGMGMDTGARDSGLHLPTPLRLGLQQAARLRPVLPLLPQVLQVPRLPQLPQLPRHFCR